MAAHGVGVRELDGSWLVNHDDTVTKRVPGIVPATLPIPTVSQIVLGGNFGNRSGWLLRVAGPVFVVFPANGKGPGNLTTGAGNGRRSGHRPGRRGANDARWRPVERLVEGVGTGRVPGRHFVMVGAMYDFNDRIGDLEHAAEMRALIGQLRRALPRRLPASWAREPRLARYRSLDAIVTEISSMSAASNDLVVALMDPDSAGLEHRTEVLLCGLAPIAIDRTADRCRVGHLLTELAIITAGTERLEFTMHAAHGLVSRAMARSRRERARLYNDAETHTTMLEHHPSTVTGSPAMSPEDEALAALCLQEFRTAADGLNLSVSLDDILAAYANGEGTAVLGYERVYRWRRRARPLFDQLTAA